MKLGHMLALPIVSVLSFAAFLSFVTAAASAPLINVDLRNARILENIANNLNVNVRNIPITVQAPIAVAAIVCGVPVTVLGTAFNRGPASCYANQSSAALNTIVRRVIALQTLP